MLGRDARFLIVVLILAVSLIGTGSRRLVSVPVEIYTEDLCLYVSACVSFSSRTSGPSAIIVDLEWSHRSQGCNCVINASVRLFV